MGSIIGSQRSNDFASMIKQIKLIGLCIPKASKMSNQMETEQKRK